MLRTVGISGLREQDGQELTVEDLAVLIRDQLVTWPLRGGERIFEAQIARDMEVSRPLVREACRVLESEGLLVYTQNKGFALKRLTREEVLHLVEFRIILEEAAFVAAASLEDRTEVVDQMRKAYQGIEMACITEDPARQISADVAFHRVVIEHTGNPWILHSFDRMSTQFRYAIRLMSRSLNDFKVYAPSHIVLIDYVEQGNAQLAREEINRHIRMFLPNLLKRIKE